jgi:hypothetical protein
MEGMEKKMNNVELKYVWPKPGHFYKADEDSFWIGPSATKTEISTTGTTAGDWLQPYTYPDTITIPWLTTFNELQKTKELVAEFKKLRDRQKCSHCHGTLTSSEQKRYKELKEIFNEIL